MSYVTRKGAAPAMQRAPGVTLRVIGDGEQAMLIEVEIEAGSVVSMHTHPHQQTGRLLAGRMRFEIAGETYGLEPGDCWSIPGGVPHEATGIEKCLVVEVFAPPREDFRAGEVDASLAS
jgi:quercetin dioxygenase-like cupin family protein